MTDLLLVLATARSSACPGATRGSARSSDEPRYAIGLALSVLMLVYLAYALVKPERF